MAYRFIVGRSGSGKTSRALQDLIAHSLEHRDCMHIVLVPEQYTMHIQKEVLRLHPYHAATNIDVLSFRRLAHRVFKELHIKLPSVLDDMAKALIIRKVAGEHRKELRLWKEQFSRYGFVDKFKSLLSELLQYGIGPEQIREIAEDESRVKSGILKNKLSEIALIYTAFQDFIKGKHITNEEVLDVLAKHLPRSASLRGAYIVFDGFTGFTPIQFRLVEIMLAMAAECRFCICADEAEIDRLHLDEDELFFMSMHMAKTVNALADRNGVSQKESIYLDASYKKSRSLQHLERYFLREEGCTPISAAGDIQICAADSPEEEVKCLMNRLHYLIRQEGYRYRDIAVLSGDLSRYGDRLSQQLQAAGIPHHIDSNIRISTNMFVDFIDSVLQLVTENYSYHALMRYIRSPFAFAKSCSSYTLYSFDNYLFMTGLASHKRLSKAFTYMPKAYKGVSLEDLNALRVEILQDTEDLYGLFQKKRKEEEGLQVSDIVAALYELFDRLDIEEKLSALGKEFAESGDEKRAREYTGVYESVVSLFAMLEKLLQDEPLQKKEFLELFRAGLSQISLGLIPSVLDTLFIGDMLRSRTADVKVVFILGMNEGLVPHINSAHSLISDREKVFLEEQYHLRLSQTLKQSVYEQKYYMYLALSKASHRLYLSYANTDASMKTIQPASILQNIISLYTDLQVEKYEGARCIYTREELEENMAACLRRYGLSADLRDISQNIRDLLQRYDMESLLLFANLMYRKEALGEDLAASLFGDILKVSVSKLESYAACPYQYFVRYGLQLFERRAYNLGSLEIGNLAHAALEELFRDYMRERDAGRSEGFSAYLENNTDSRVESAVSKVLLAQEENKYADSAKNAYVKERILRLLRTNAEVFALQLEQGKFEPRALEFGFDIRDAELYDLKLENGRKMYISGKIDRIDVYDASMDAEDRQDYLAVKIIDYKTGKVKWDRELMQQGLQMQLAFYLDIALRLYRKEYKKKVEPAAMFYAGLAEHFVRQEDFARNCRLREEILGRALEEEEKREISKELLLSCYKPNGLIYKDKHIAAALDRELFAGDEPRERESRILPLSAVPLMENEELKGWDLQDKDKKTLADPEDIRDILDSVGEKIRFFGSRILAGDIQVSPVEDERFSCMYCDYRSLCGFDKRIKGYDYRSYTEKTEEKEEA